MIVFDDNLSSLPCNWDVQVDCCDGWDDYTDTLQEAAAEFGALFMWAATGRRFGLCQKTIRPCGRTQEPRLSGWYWSEGTWAPYIFNGVWRNCAGCNASYGCCPCEPRCQVWLPAPVHSIPATGITQDGVIVPVDAWEVQDGEWLVRTDGDCWPVCQNYNVATTEVDTFEVTFYRGKEVPSVLLRAAGELACEYAKSCIGAACRLPQRMTSVSRQGVSVSLADVDMMLNKGFTGITTVDQVIRSFNPYSLPSRMGIASPDWPPSARVTTYG